MSLRISTLLWILLLVLGAFGLYMVKYKVQDLKKEVALTEKNLVEEKKNLHVAKAEWAFLTRPERIRRLAGKYLKVKPVMGKQMAALATIPFYRPSPEAASKMAASGENSSLVTFTSGAESDDNAPDE